MSDDPELISPELFERVLSVMPILCVDVVIRNEQGKYLLVKRVNEPLKGKWWVIGGRVHKGETLERAAIRKVMTESSLTVRDLQVIGYYEDHYVDHPLNVADSIHAVSIVFMATIEDMSEIRLDSQSSNWKFAKSLPSRFKIKSIRSGCGIE